MTALPTVSTPLTRQPVAVGTAPGLAPPPPRPSRDDGRSRAADQDPGLTPSRPRPAPRPSRDDGRSRATDQDPGHRPRQTPDAPADTAAATTSSSPSSAPPGQDSPVGHDFRETLESALGSALAGLPGSVAAIAQPTPLPADGGVGTGAIVVSDAPARAVSPSGIPAVTPGRPGSTGVPLAALLSGSPAAAAPFTAVATTTTAGSPAGTAAAASPAGDDGAEQGTTELGSPATPRPSATVLTRAATSTTTGEQEPDGSVRGRAPTGQAARSGPASSAETTLPTAATEAASAPGSHALPTIPAIPTGPTAGSSTSAPTTEAVARQVFPEITRLAQGASPGTHRLSITLHPEDLGEVKVTVVVRAGTLQVHLSAETPAARAALAGGSPELHRMLELAGSAGTRVVVRESGAGADARAQQGSTGFQETAGGQGQPGQRHFHQAGREFSAMADGLLASSTTSTTSGRGSATTPLGPPPTTTTTGRLDRLM